MKKETEFGTVEYGGEYVTNPFSPLDTADTAPDHLHTDTPYLAQSLIRTANIWRWMHPHATVEQRRELLKLVGAEMEVEACACIRG